ncbi:MAG: winged helix-turn-helix domain-containing protein [Hyphomicrobiales bacterium]|nr:winged helix-turn-helix domain-containing protein [Hyphomicrobiales bacterium]
MDNQKDKIAIIANNQNLLDLLEESFLLYGKFSISIFTNNSILDLIKKVDNTNVLLVSIDILDNLDKKYLNFFRENEKKSIFLINKEDKKDILLEKQIKPKSIINIPLSISNVIQIIEGLIREEANKMNDIIIGNFSLDVVGRKISLNKINEKLTEKETEILWKLLNKIDHRIPQKEFLKEIWGYDENIETRTLETHIYRIRKKLNSIGAKDYKINNIDNSYILSLKKLN